MAKRSRRMNNPPESPVAARLLDILNSNPQGSLDDILALFQPVQLAQAPIGPQEQYIGARPRPDTVQTVLPPSGVAQTPGVGTTTVPTGRPMQQRKPLQITVGDAESAPPFVQETEVVIPAGAARGTGTVLQPMEAEGSAGGAKPRGRALTGNIGSVGRTK